MARTRMTMLLVALLPALSMAADIKGIAVGMSAADIKAKYSDMLCTVPARDPAAEVCGVTRGKGSRSLGDLDTYAGEQVDSFYVFFNTGVVRRVRVHLKSSAFIVVATALEAKYGLAASSETSVVQNRMGAKFDQEERVWKDGDDRIEVKRHSSTLTLMEVQLFNSTDLRREVEELKSRAKGAAKDL